MAQRVAPLGAVITGLCDVLKMRHAERLSQGKCGLEEGTYLVISSTVSVVSQLTVQVLWWHL